jgi:Fe-S cluster assembly protein SufD
MAEVTVMRTAAETALAQSFEALRDRLPGRPEDRAQAFQLFAERGLPHRRVEEFKYTDLRAGMREAAPLASRPDAAAARAALETATAFADVEAVRLAIVDGHLVAEASDLARLPAGVEVAPLAEALASGHPLLDRLGPVQWTRTNPVYQLNTAFMTDGALIRVAAGAQVEELLHLRFVTASSEAVATATRVLVLVEEGASVTIAESHESADGVAHQPNDAVEVIVGDGAFVRHVRVNREGDAAVALSTLAVTLGAKSAFDTVNVVTGAGLSRHQVYAVFEGDHAKLNVNGAAMLNGRQHADSTLIVDHAALHGESRELFKTVVDGDATGCSRARSSFSPTPRRPTAA